MKAVKLTISGKVQGVRYRRWFAQYAVALGGLWCGCRTGKSC